VPVEHELSVVDRNSARHRGFEARAKVERTGSVRGDARDDQMVHRRRKRLARQRHAIALEANSRASRVEIEFTPIVLRVPGSPKAQREIAHRLIRRHAQGARHHLFLNQFLGFGIFAIGNQRARVRQRSQRVGI
jgi:hypothetical protein